MIGLNTQITRNEIFECLKVFIQQIGLNGTDVILSEDNVVTLAHDPNVRVAILLPIPADPRLTITTNKPYVNHFRDLLDKVRQSPVVKSELNELQVKLKEAAGEIDFLRSEIQKLTKYETHYNLEMKLRHGEK